MDAPPSLPNTLLAAISVLLGWPLSNQLARGEPIIPERPNIIFFLVDDYDKLETSVYGGNVLTPNLDRLAWQ